MLKCSSNSILWPSSLFDFLLLFIWPLLLFFPLGTAISLHSMNHYHLHLPISLSLWFFERETEIPSLLISSCSPSLLLHLLLLLTLLQSKPFIPAPYLCCCDKKMGDKSITLEQIKNETVDLVYISPSPAPFFFFAIYWVCC